MLSSFIRRVKRFVRGRYPLAAVTYLNIREFWLQRRDVVVYETPFGFRLCGNREMGRGEFESGEARVIREHLKSTNVFVDVGANIGYYACMARSTGVHTVAVEPLSQNLEFLYRNLALNDYRDVEVFPLCLGETPGIIELYGAGTHASALADWAGHKGYQPDVVRTVPASTLDILLNRFDGDRLLIKIDVEGWEFPVLQGATAILHRTPRPVWVVEVALKGNHPGANPNFARTFEVFWEAGYSASVADLGTPVLAEHVQAWVDGRDVPPSENFLFV